MVLKDNLYIFNLCEFSNIPLKTIQRVYDGANGNHITPDVVFEILGNTPTSRTINKKMLVADYSYLSLYSLVSCGINIYIVETLRDSFSSIEDIAENTSKLVSFHFQDRTLTKILNFINDRAAVGVGPKVKLKTVILDELANRYDPISKNDLFVILAKNTEISVPEYYDTLNELAFDKKIKISPMGIEIRHPTLEEYFSDYSNTSKNIQAVELYLSGKSIQEISSDFSVTRQRVDQMIKSQIQKMPIFDNEYKYKNLMSEYDLSYPVMDRLGFGHSKLIKYIKIKYALSPSKKDIDFVIAADSNGKNLIGTDLGNYILSENKLAYINEKLLKRDFRSLFCEYISSKNLISFNSGEILEGFKKFLFINNVDLGLDDLSYSAINRKIDNLGDFLNCGSSNYYWLDMERISKEFIDKARDFLENFYGYCSVNVFLQKNKKLCEQQSISDEYQLFSILKRIFSQEFENDIDFIRMPTISTKGLAREDFYIGLISDLQPVSVSDFMNFVSDEYGFNKNSLYANLYAFLSKYINKDGMLSVDIEDIDFESQEMVVINEILNGRSIVPVDEFTSKVKKLLPDKVDFYTSKHIIKKIGYSYRNDSIYLNKYNSLYEALVALADQLPIVVSESTLSKYLPSDALNTRYSLIKQQALFLKYSDENYLNVGKRVSRDRLLAFRNEVIHSLKEDDVYTLSDLFEAVFYKRICEHYNDICNLFEAMGYSLLTNLLDGSLEITSLDSDDPFVFGTGTLVSNKQVIRYIVRKEKSIDKNELISLLNSKYGINHDYWNSFFFELGLYYNNYTDKVYISKERCDQELQDYLNKEGK